MNVYALRHLGNRQIDQPIFGKTFSGTVAAKELDQMKKFAALPPGAQAKKVASIALGLSPLFRISTSPAHLLKIGFGAEFEGFMRQDPLALLARPENRQLRLNGTACSAYLRMVCRKSALKAGNRPV